MNREDFIIALTAIGYQYTTADDFIIDSILLYKKCIDEAKINLHTTGIVAMSASGKDEINPSFTIFDKSSRSMQVLLRQLLKKEKLQQTSDTSAYEALQALLN